MNVEKIFLEIEGHASVDEPSQQQALYRFLFAR